MNSNTYNQWLTAKIEAKVGYLHGIRNEDGSCDLANHVLENLYYALYENGLNPYLEWQRETNN